MFPSINHQRIPFSITRKIFTITTSVTLGNVFVNRSQKKIKIIFANSNFFFLFSALTVRYLTRRFIGEYRSNTDLLYRQTIPLEQGVIDVEIVDISTENENEFPTEQIQWADACMVVYSITSRSSFEYALRSLGELKSIQNSPSAYLVGNKADLDHLREVSTQHFSLF